MPSNLNNIKDALARLRNNHGLVLKVSRLSPGWRVTTEDEGRDVSPRLSGKMLLSWLAGYEQALDDVVAGKVTATTRV